MKHVHFANFQYYWTPVKIAFLGPFIRVSFIFVPYRSPNNFNITIFVSEFVSLLFVCVSDFSFSALAHRLICVPLAFAFAPKQVDCKDNHRDWC